MGNDDTQRTGPRVWPEHEVNAIARQAREHGEDPLASVVGQLAGYGSTCWESLEGTGVFASSELKVAVEQVIAWVHANYAERTVGGQPAGRLEAGDRLLVAGGDASEAQQQEMSQALRMFIDGDYGVVVMPAAQMVVASKDWIEERRTAYAETQAQAEPQVTEDGAIELPALSGMLEHFGMTGTPVIEHRDHELGKWVVGCPACEYLLGHVDVDHTTAPLGDLTDEERAAGFTHIAAAGRRRQRFQTSDVTIRE